MIRTILIGISLLAFIFTFNDRNLVGVWLRDGDVSFIIFENDKTYKWIQFWDDRNGESETYNWDRISHGLWSTKANKLCVQKLRNWPNRNPEKEAVCSNYQLTNNYLIIDFISHERKESIKYIKVK